jgi:hypothetical protein
VSSITLPFASRLIFFSCLKFSSDIDRDMRALVLNVTKKREGDVTCGRVQSTWHSEAVTLPDAHDLNQCLHDSRQ